MKINQIMDVVYSIASDSDYSKTCDTIKSGDPFNETEKVAVAMFPTPDVIKNVSAWGAGLLIVHEPCYYNHRDIHSYEKIESLKRNLIENSGITIYRFHDHPHFDPEDMIAKGEFKSFGLAGSVDYSSQPGLVRMYLDEPITPLELAKRIEQKCGVKHIRICGSINDKCKVISGMFGAAAGIFEELKKSDSEIVIAGEVCEWSMAEYARDASQLGFKKSLLIMGHEGSERDGMKYSAVLLKEMLPEIEVRYFESGEAYTYTDN